MSHTEASNLERTTMAKVSWRLLPLIVVIYFVAYIDRTNVGFAALGMNRELGFTAYIYGWGAGIFFLGYFLFEVPSNIALTKDGVGDIERFVSIRRRLGERLTYLGGLPTAEVFAGAYRAMGCPV